MEQEVEVFVERPHVFGCARSHFTLILIHETHLFRRELLLNMDLDLVSIMDIESKQATKFFEIFIFSGSKTGYNFKQYHIGSKRLISEISNTR